MGLTPVCLLVLLQGTVFATRESIVPSVFIRSGQAAVRLAASRLKTSSLLGDSRPGKLADKARTQIAGLATVNI